MEIKEQTSKEYFSILTIIHSALLIGQIVFLIIFYYLVSTGQSETDESLNEIFQIMVPLFILGGLVASYFLTQNKLKIIMGKSDLRDKLSEYRTTLIIKYAILEGPSLFGLICYFLTGNNIFLALSGIMILYFAIIRPTRNKTGNDLKLSRRERDQIENPNAKVSMIRLKE